MVCGRVCVMVWGICFGVGVLRGVLCGNGNGVWIAASTPSPALPRCGLRPAGEGVSGCRFGLCVWSLLRGLWCAETAMAVGLLPLPPPRPSPAAGFALRGREWFGGECCPVVGLGCVFGRCSAGCLLPPPQPSTEPHAKCSRILRGYPPTGGGSSSAGGMLSGCRFGLCVWSLLRGLWCAETAMAVGLLPLPPPRPSPAAGFALRGREWFGCRFGVAGGYGLRPNRPYVFCGFMPLLFPGGRPVL